MSLSYNKTIVGLDYSMNSPGLCVIDGEAIFLYAFCNNYTGKRKFESGHFKVEVEDNIQSYRIEIERYGKLATRVLTFVTDFKRPRIFLEDYSMGSKGRVFHIAENAALLKYEAFLHNIPVQTVAPTSLKKFATGKGNAKKEDMHEAFVKETNINLHEALLGTKRKLGNPVTDLVDAYYIARWGQAQLNEAKKEGSETQEPSSNNEE